MKRKLALPIILLGISLVCCLAVVLALGDFYARIETSPQRETIGFDFSNQTPKEPQGGMAGAAHVFVHNYSMPSAGFITGVTYLNDRELDGPELPETITLLVLRPVVGGWEVVYRIALPRDDSVPTTTGVTTFDFPHPVPVQKGYVFAHWLEEAKGPIPMNIDADAVAGRSVGKFGFSSEDVEVGQIIKNEGFTGNRDYFLNVIFEFAP
ncbi:MAG: hypothetical protein B6I38_05325 [Anaerolineaceae bacterium 4572_5.1]|nr:MAG: hypothetical protein B5M51_03430 [Anaerolinea sp. 4484_236]OQY31785.1 MAG: hypothetical protein B6I38_05325 [Anaerolineaceae bacterium 4572_5.1]RLD11072.1 MAG: hypothetical protein DRI56_01695 [Chloroflexota bacterium]